VEFLASLRAIPNMLVLRPADAVEAVERDDRQLHQSRHPERRPHVVGEDEVGRADRDQAAMTHQPVEFLASLRAIPNMLVLRPADAVEAVECWEMALANPWASAST
jgi:transketolase